MWSASQVNRLLICATALAVMAAVAIGHSAPSHAQFPGLNGKIAFAREDAITGQRAIWTVNPDGSDPTLISDSLRDSSGPDWSPQGDKIAFAAKDQGSNSDDVFVVNADGTNLVNLTNHSQSDDWPSWSPDGLRIAFNSRRTGFSQIWMMDADGSNQTQLTFDTSLSPFEPEWSPDGSKIAFHANSPDGYDIYVMNADGTNVTKLTTDPAEDLGPHWAPTGDRIIFNSNRDGGLEVWEMNADGTDQTQVTHETPPKGNRIADVSPDGNYIVYSKEPSGGQFEWRLWIADRDGSNEHPITSVYQDTEPDWQVTPQGETPAPTSSFVPSPTPTESPSNVPTPSATGLTPTPSPMGVGGTVDLVVSEANPARQMPWIPVIILSIAFSIAAMAFTYTRKTR